MAKLCEVLIIGARIMGLTLAREAKLCFEDNKLTRQFCEE